jgi:steroid 5-alpha reductase family enzyme
MPTLALSDQRGAGNLMTVINLLAINAAILIVCFAVLWLISLKSRDVTPVDSFWALGMVAMAFTSYAQSAGAPDRKLLLFGLCAAWGLRLGIYMLRRWRSHGPDRRYQTMLGKAETARGWGFAQASLRMVYLVQAPLLFIVFLPVQLGQIDTEPPIGLLGYLGWTVAVIGIVFESIGDWQLSKFKANPANRDTVMDRGLWRYTRHPNYFGDACTGGGFS